jgi:dipeptidyl aminopeptidase/acylaminoacyl peptidase
VAISIEGGTGPVWSRDGRELYYRAGDDLVSVQVRTDRGLVLGGRRRLLDLSRFDSGYFHEFDVSPDGQRFLMIRTEPRSRPTRLDIITRWFDELNRLVSKR